MSQSGEPPIYLDGLLATRWASLGRLAVLGAGLLLAGGLGDLVLFNPRLLTWGELIPPDEGVVGALLPGAVGLAIAGVLVWRSRRVPRELIIAGGTVTARFTDRSAEDTVELSRIRVASRGDRFEGTRVEVESGTGRTRRWWVDPEMARVLRLRTGQPAAPVSASDPAR
ncbi:MAG TPA: hypothetical protein VEY07_00585 [Thermoplasmata archaeon]|nr:hypothetical protein [Thermoplasmata archaeon]